MLRSNPPPSATDASSTRRLILDAAAKVFLAKGYQGASMELVALESGAGRRTLYNHFKSKKALFDATIALLWDNMPVGRIAGREGVSSRPEEVLREIGGAIADFWAPEEAAAFLRLIIREGGQYPELAESFFTFGRDPARSAVSDYMERLAENKALTIPDLDLAVTQFIDLIIGPVLLDRLVAGKKPPSRKQQRYIVEEAVEMILCRYRRKD